MNIYEKMAAITAELSRVAKNLSVGEGKSSYKAVGEADVLAAVKPLEEKYKVYSYPFSRNVIESDILTSTKTYNGQETTTSKMYMRLETIYRFVNTENPDEHIDVTTYGDGIDAADKAPGKAMTYGDKYALLKAYKIITGDDPDQNHSDENAVKGRAQKAPATQSPAPGGYGYTQNPPVPVCVACGCEIAPAVHDYSVKNFGRPLCRTCQSKAKSNG